LELAIQNPRTKEKFSKNYKRRHNMVDNFLRRAKDFILGSNEDQRDAEYDDRQIRPASEDPYGDPADQGYGDIRPASEDSYGDPADQGYGDIRPASEDPYGDPADQGYGDIRPASEDPYGDPADQGYGIPPVGEDPYGDPADQGYR
jgi:hypothetical protein